MTKPKKFETDSPTFDEIQAVRKPRTRSEWIPLDGGLLREIEELEVDLRQAERDDERQIRTPQAPALLEQLEDLRDRAQQAAVRFTVTALPRKAYRDLKEAHPAAPLSDALVAELGRLAALRAAATITPEEYETAKKRVLQQTRPYDIDSFAPALITACFVEPSGVDGQVIWEEWDAGIAETLFGMAIMVNEEPPRVPSGARSTARAAASEPSSTTAALEE